MKTSKKEGLQNLQAAINQNLLPTLQNIPVGIPAQIARITGLPESTIHNALATGKITQYELPGKTKVIDLPSLITYFQTSKPGRKSLQTNFPSEPKAENLSQIKNLLQKLINTFQN